MVATVDDAGRSVVLPNAVGETKTPSVVCFESPGSVLVGSAARNVAAALPDRTVALIKRQMGAENLLSFDGEEYTPEAVSALILRALVAGTVPAAGADADGRVRAVITVPAYFGVREREATQQAGLLAGIEVLELVSEPVAAAIYYSQIDPDPPGTVLVYDLGGGTFDASVLVRTPSGMAVIATDGDTELGGADWDRRLAGTLCSDFIERFPALEDEITDDESFLSELTDLAERVKQDLSASESRSVRLRRHGTSAVLDVSRERFEAMTADLSERTFHCVRRLLGVAAAKGAGEVETALLVGGSTRMPMIAAGLGKEFGWRPRAHDPDFAVAKGAALRAAQLTSSGPGERVRPGGSAGSAGLAASVGSVVSRGFGLLLHDSHHDAGGKGMLVSHVIHQNEPLPIASRECVVATVLNGQPSVRIQVYEQAGAVESPVVEHNRRVLDGELTGLPPALPAGSPIRVVLSLGLDGRLALTAVEPHSGARLTLEACIEGVLDTGTRDRVAATLSGLTIRH
ncbi:Hsp70 family protein [Flindersiella endophytica]